MKIFFILTLAALSAFAAHEKTAHVHGQGSITIAFDKEIGKVEFTAPGHDVAGFEGAPKNQKQKDARANVIQKLGDQVTKMIRFDDSLKCEWSVDHIEIGESGHADLDAAWNVTCAKSPIGTTVRLDIQGTFPSLRKVEIIALLDGVQKSSSANKSGSSLVLK